MSLDTVARFRLTAAEKQKLEKRAADRGMDLSAYLRDCSGLSPSSEVEASSTPAPSKPKASRGSSKKAKAKEPAPKEDKPAKESQGPGAQAIEDLAFRIHNREGKTMKVARQEAKETLGG